MKKYIVLLVMSLFLIVSVASAVEWSVTSGGMRWQVAKHVSTDFTGASPANGHGDEDGTGNPYTVFTVTGDVIIKQCWGIVNTSLTDTGTASLELGVTSNTGGVLAQIADVTTMDDGETWTDLAGISTGTLGVVDETTGSNELMFINDGGDIIETTDLATGDNIETGQIDYYCIWAPAEPGASVASDGS